MSTFLAFSSGVTVGPSLRGWERTVLLYLSSQRMLKIAEFVDGS